MSGCDRQTSGMVDLYFYGELNAIDRARLEHHLRECAECRRALEDLATIRAALAGRPDVAAPEHGDWTPFMTRLNDALRLDETEPRATGSHETVVAVTRTRPHAGYFAVAALLALVTITVLLAWRTQDRGADVRSARAEVPVDTMSSPGASAPATGPASRTQESAFATLSERHFERSKLVVLGLATKDPASATAPDWEYERELAETLLSDTRLYRLAAEERGLVSIARVMEDLELVLLQASMSEKVDASSLEQLQRLIRKRDLVTKMDLATAAGI